jgi:hypothetical protein
MTREQLLGRTIVVLAFAAIGVVPLLAGHLPAGLLPLRTPLPAALAGLLGTAFAAAVVAAGVSTRSSRPVLLAGAFPATALLLLHVPRLVTEYRDPVLWSSLLQMLAITGGTLYLGNRDERSNLGNLLNLRTVLWCTALAGFGVQHFMYPTFIAGLIPAWLPARTVLAWATGIGFELAALSFALQRYPGLAGRMLCFMFWSWVVVLHAPRIAAQPELEAGWTSGLVALGFGGVALILSGTGEPLPAALRGRKRTPAEAIA